MNNNKGKRNGTNNRSKTSKKDVNQKRSGYTDKVSYPKSEGDNAFEWYNRYPDLIEAAARIPFYRKPGMRIDIMESNVLGTLGRTIPGVMALRWAPSIGYSEKLTDPANIAAYELYAKVRSAYSGTLSADAPDIMIYILAMDSLFSYISYLKRVYRIVNTYTPENYETPYTLLKAMGITKNTANTLMQNKPAFLGAINDLILKCNRYNVPAVFDYINRHVWMSENVYLDAPTPSSQFYVFVPKYFLKFTEDSNKAGSLKYVANPANLTDLANPVKSLYDFGLDLLNALADYDEAYTISGYLQRAFEGKPMFRMEAVQSGDTFQGVYSQEVLMQIENSFSVDVDLTNVTITQDASNALISKIEKSYIGTAGSVNIGINDVKHVINLHGVAPTPQNVVEATRLITNHRLVDTKYYIDCGSEILLKYELFAGDYNTLFSSVVTADIPYGNAAKELSPSIFTFLSTVVHYDWHPILRMLITRSNYNTGSPVGTSVAVCNLVGDIQNITNVSPEDLGGITRVCLLSEFNSYSL